MSRYICLEFRFTRNHNLYEIFSILLITVFNVLRLTPSSLITFPSAYTLLHPVTLFLTFIPLSSISPLSTLSQPSPPSHLAHLTHLSKLSHYTFIPLPKNLSQIYVKLAKTNTPQTTEIGNSCGHLHTNFVFRQDFFS